MLPTAPPDGAMPHPPERPKRRAQVVVDHIGAELAAGRIRAGDRLPTEHEFADRLAVSRNSVREAIRMLQAAGLVDVRHGTGSFVREPVDGPLAQLMLFRTLVAQSTPAALVEVRRLFERSCAELAATRRTEADLAAMRGAIDRLRRLGGDPQADAAALLDADLAFHRAVYRASGNELIASLAEFVLTAVSPWIGRSLARHGGLATADMHEAEYRLIEQRDAGGAASASESADRNMEYWREGLVAPPRPPG